uniref:Uncharacterized protein n=1 Tax=Anguilla anguilla TaxID=7936 RepID=A0A0E9PVG7_ANGAN
MALSSPKGKTFRSS